MMGALAEETGWLRGIAGIAKCELDGDAERLAARRRADGLVFTRWALVVFNFEHQLYADPDHDDLNLLWWDLVGRLQLVKRPSGRDKPDRAAKIHIAVAPVYYHKYVLGNLISGQLRGHLEAHVTHGYVLRERGGGMLPRGGVLWPRRPRNLARHSAPGHRGGD